MGLPLVTSIYCPSFQLFLQWTVRSHSGQHGRVAQMLVVELPLGHVRDIAQTLPQRMVGKTVKGLASN